MPNKLVKIGKQTHKSRNSNSTNFLAPVTYNVVEATDNCIRKEEVSVLVLSSSDKIFDNSGLVLTQPLGNKEAKAENSFKVDALECRATRNRC